MKQGGRQVPSEGMGIYGSEFYLFVYLFNHLLFYHNNHFLYEMDRKLKSEQKEG